jgi:hypothetical protein
MVHGKLPQVITSAFIWLECLTKKILNDVRCRVPVWVPVWYANGAGLRRIPAMGQTQSQGLQVTVAEKHKRCFPRGGIGRRA